MTAVSIHRTSEAQDHEDFDGQAFNQLLDLDANFGEEWVSQLYEKVGRPSRRDDSRDCAFIWRRSDFTKVMDFLDTRLVTRVYAASHHRVLVEIPTVLHVNTFLNESPAPS